MVILRLSRVKGDSVGVLGVKKDSGFVGNEKGSVKVEGLIEERSMPLIVRGLDPREVDRFLGGVDSGVRFGVD